MNKIIFLDIDGVLLSLDFLQLSVLNYKILNKKLSIITVLVPILTLDV